MPRKIRKTCPICTRPCGPLTGCKLNADGKSGFCAAKSTNRSGKRVPFGAFEQREVKLDKSFMNKIKRVVQHESFPQWLSGLFHWTYKVTGRYIQPTLEQWERGFMFDRDPYLQAQLWMRISFAFIDWHKRQDLPLRSDEEEVQLIGSFCRLSFSPPEDAPDSLEKECYISPEGWETEVERSVGLIAKGIWSPPVGVGEGLMQA